MEFFFNKLNINGTLVGFEKGPTKADYYCTPLHSRVIGWNGPIHFCIIEGYNRVIFAVNPDNYGNHTVCPVALNFSDFLRLLITLKNTLPIALMVNFNTKKEFEEFLRNDEYCYVFPEQEKIIQQIKDGTDLEPMENPYEYVKGLQDNFDYNTLTFSDKYYEFLKIENPNKRRTAKKSLILNK